MHIIIFLDVVPRSFVNVGLGKPESSAKESCRQSHRSPCGEERQRVVDHMLGRKKASKRGGRSAALMNALPGRSPLLLRLPAETSGILL